MTKIPHSPRITLGTAASNSIKIVSGCRTHWGASSVRYTAVPMLSGTAISSAINEETSVPKMNGSAPKLSLTGSHSELVRNRQPNFASAKCEPFANSSPITMMSAKIDSAMSSASDLKMRSPA